MTVELPHEAYLTALSSLKEVGPGRLRWMLTLGTPDEVWARVRAGRLPRMPRRVGPDELRSAWRLESAGIEPGRCWDRCIRLGVGVVSLGGAGYPPAQSADRELLLPVKAHDQDRKLREPVLDLREQIETIAAGHRQVEHNRIEFFRESCEGLVTVGSLGHVDAGHVVLDDGTNPSAHDGVIIDEQDPLHSP